MNSSSPASLARTFSLRASETARRRTRILLGLSLLALPVTGCRQEMHNQPRLMPLRGTSFYADGRSARPQVAHTIARSQSVHPTYFETGRQGANEGNGLPMPVTLALLERGEEGYNVFCSPCHSRAGYGYGMIVQRGYYRAASLHTERLRQAPLGHFFLVITQGYGAMPDYGAQIPPADRWAIAAYVRSLQLSQNAKPADVPAGTHPATIVKIAAQQGMPAGFADQAFWKPPVDLSPVAQVASAAAALAPMTAAKPGSGPKSPSPSSHAATQTGSAAASVKPRQASSTEAASSAAPAGKSGSPASVNAGKVLYLENCAVCHQSNLSGRSPQFPGLVGIVQRTSEEHVREVITNGVPDARPIMPAFGARLTAAEISQLLAYLKSVQTAP